MAPASRIRALDRFFFLRWLLSIIAFVLTTNDCCGYYDGHKSRSRSEDDILSHRHDGMSSRGPPARPAAGPFLEMEPDPVKAVDTKNRQDAVAYSDEIDICLLMIVRDEETSLRTNLPLWRDVATCYVIGVDDRTTDSTVEVILEVLPNDQPR